MNALLLAPPSVFEKKARALTGSMPDMVVLARKAAEDGPEGCSQVDIILWDGMSLNGSTPTDRLLSWRTHPHTYLIPCWMAADVKTLDERLLWPRLGIDHFGSEIEPGGLGEWLSQVSEWQQNRMIFPAIDSLTRHSVIEIASAIALRKATGELSVFDDDGSEGRIAFKDGGLTQAAVKHLRGEDAFFELLCWSKGSYQWDVRESVDTEGPPLPLTDLIFEGLKLFRDANLLYHFLPDFEHVVARTESESALDDGGVSYFTAQRQLYSLIDGTISAREILEASPLSRLRAMSCMAKWFSMGDIVNISHSPAPKTRLLIVDDSPFMCRAIEAIFSEDPRFQIVGVAHNGIEALELIEKQQPDVVTMDLVMPQMDGLAALKHIMIRNPRPVVVLSAFTGETSRLTYEAFKYGAVDVFTKPSRGELHQADMEKEELRGRVAQAAQVRMEAARYIRSRKGGSSEREPGKGEATRTAGGWISRYPLILLCCGAGGFPAFLKLLSSGSPREGLPATVTCMAMSERVVAALRPNLEKDFGMKFEIPSLSTPLEPGVSYIYPYAHHYRLAGQRPRFTLKRTLESEAPCSFDELLRSAADTAGDRLISVLISGTGDDGIEGMDYVHRKGGLTFVLSPEVCLEPGLPRRVLDRGFAQEVKTAAQLARLIEDCQEMFPDD